MPNPLTPGSATTAEEFLAYWTDALKARVRERGLRPRDVAARIHVGESSLRKRLRGEVPFAAWEFVELSSWLELPSCAREMAPGRLQLTASTTAEEFDAEAYIRTFAAFSDHSVAGVPRERVRLRICATDLPVHQILADPILTALKLYFFATGSGVNVRRRFDLSAALDTQSALLERAAEIHRTYQTIDSVEVWGRDPIASLLQQVARLARAGALTAPDTAAIIERLRAMVTRITAEAEAGAKGGGGAFRLYRNALFANNAIFLIENPHMRFSFVTVANPQFLYSDHGPTYDYLAATADAIQAQSHAIAAGGTLDGERLREQLLASISKTEAAIAAYWAAEAMF